MRILRLLAFSLAALPALLAGPAPAQAQRAQELLAGAGLGGTYYCIVSRCDVGLMARGSVGYSPAPALVIQADVRWHGCADCDRFLIGDAGVQLRLPTGRFRPFVAAGVGLSSDPDFFGDAWGGWAAVGSWLWLGDRWGAQAELRGRQVGSGDHMGELTVMLARRVPLPGS